MDVFGEFNTYYEHYDGDKTDAAVEFADKLISDGKIKNEQKADIVQKLVEKETVKDNRLNKLSNLLDDGFNVRKILIGEQMSEYGELPARQTANTFKAFIEAGHTPEEAAALIYYNTKDSVPAEQHDIYVEMLSDMETLYKPKQSKVKQTIANDVIKNAQPVEPIVEGTYTVQKDTPYYAYSPEPSYIEIEQQLKEAERKRNEAIKRNPNVDIDEHDKAASFMRDGKYTDINQAISEYTFKQYGLKWDKLPENEKKRKSTAIVEAAKKIVPQNKIDYALPKISEILEKSNGDIDEAGKAYFSELYPILEQLKYDNKSIEKVASNIIEAVDVMKEYKDNPAVLNTILTLLDIPFTAAFSLDIKTEKVDQNTKKILAEYFKNNHITDYPLYVDESDPEKNKWTNWALLNGAFIALGVIGRAAAIPKLTTKQFLKVAAKETASNFTLGVTDVGETVGKMAYSKMAKKQFEKALMESGEEMRAIAKDVTEHLQQSINAKIEIDNQDLENLIYDYAINKTIRGEKFDHKQLIVNVKEIADDVKYMQEQAKFYKRIHDNMLSIYGSEWAKVVEQKNFFSGQYGNTIIDLMRKQPDEFIDTIRFYAGDETDELVERFYGSFPQFKYTRDIEDIHNIYGAEVPIVKRKIRIAPAVKEEKILKRVRSKKQLDDIGKNIEDIYEEIQELTARGVAGDYSSEFSLKQVAGAFKLVSTNIAQKFGEKGEFTVHLLNHVMHETELLASDILARNYYSAPELLKKLNPIIKGDKIETHFGVMEVEEYKELINASKRGYKNFYEHVMEQSVELQVKSEKASTYSEGLKNFINEFNDLHFKEIGEIAEKTGLRVYNRELKEAIKLKRLAPREWKIYNSKIGYYYKGLYSSEKEAKKAAEEMYSHEFKRISNYRPLYVDIDAVIRDRKRIVADLVNSAADKKTETEMIAELLKMKTGSATKWIREDALSGIVDYYINKMAEKGEKAFTVYDSQGLYSAIAAKIAKDKNLLDALENRFKVYFESYKKKMYERKYGHLQYERVEWLPSKYYKRKNLFALDQDYIYRSAKRLTEIKYLGGKDEMFSAIAKSIQNDMGDAAAYDYMRYIETLFGRYGYNRTYDNIIAGLSTYQVITKMTLSALSQFSQIAYSAARGDIKSFYKTIGTYARRKDYNTIHKIMEHTGTMLVNLRSLQKREEIGLTKVADFALKYTGMTAADMLSRKFSSIQGYHYVKELAELAKVNPSKYASKLADLNINVAELAKRNYELTDLEIRKAMQKFEIDTNFRHTMLDMPELVSTKAGTFMTSLMSTTIRQTKFIKKYVYDEVKKGNYVPLLSLASVGFITNAPKQMVLSWLNGDLGENYKILDPLVDIGLTFGIIGNILETLYYGMPALGVNVSTALNVEKVVHYMLHGQVAQAIYYLTKEVPAAHKLLFRDKRIKAIRKWRKAEENTDFRRVEKFDKFEGF